MSELSPWKTLDRRVVLRYDRYLTVEEHTVELPNGTVIENWPWIITPDYVIVVAVTTGGQFLCFRQTKYAAEGITLAPVGGYLEPGEDPSASARRELREETGYEASKWVNLGRYAVDGNRGAGTAHLFLALGAHRVTERNADDLEEQVLVFLDREEVRAALEAGEFKVLPWPTAFALALLRLDRERRR